MWVRLYNIKICLNCYIRQESSMAEINTNQAFKNNINICLYSLSTYHVPGTVLSTRDVLTHQP